MRKIIVVLYLMSLCTLSGLPVVAMAAEVVVVDYPPMMIKHGNLPGYSVEIITEVNKRLGVDYPISFLPFQRAIKTVQMTTNTLHPALYRKPQREHQYTWIAKYHQVNDVFLTVGEPINSLEEARELELIGVEDQAAMDVFLTAQGFTNLVRFTSAETTARVLQAGRIDAWALTDVLALWTWKELQFEESLVPGAVITTSDVYIVGGPAFPAEQASLIERTVQQMLDDGSIREIIAKYR